MTQSKAKEEFEQNFSPVVSFLETLFIPDEELPQLASELIDNSTWYKSLNYQTRDSWSRSRRVVSKVEYGAKGTNIRFVGEHPNCAKRGRSTRLSPSYYSR